MNKVCHNPESLFDSRQYGFSQIVVGQGSRLVCFAGQVAWDEEQNIVGENDLRAQVWQALDNVQTVMRTVGGTLDNILALRLYIRDDWMGKTGPVTEALHYFFPGDQPPAATWIGVPSLARSEFLIEIEGMALLD